MKIVFFGTNGWYSSPTGDTPCILIDAKEQYIILDAGNGIYKLDTYIRKKKPIALFLSHFHIDHISGLHILSKFDFEQGIDVYIGEDRVKDFITIANPPFTVGFQPDKRNINNLKTAIRLHTFSEKEQRVPFTFSALKQYHAYGDYGFRIEVEGKTVAYTGDCGYTKQAEELAKGVDLLICECSYKKINEADKWGHFDPSQAAKLAKDCGVRQLILTHFAANLYTTLKERKVAEQEAKKIFPHTLAATDGMEFNL